MSDKWDEIMEAAEQAGFIAMAAGGVAVLMTHEVQKKEGIYEKTQYACGLRDKLKDEGDIKNSDS
jgi:hypothetical protein